MHVQLIINFIAFISTCFFVTDVKSIRYKASISPFPKDNFILNIEALKPTTCVLIKGPEDMPSYVVDMYCGGFGEIIEKKEYGPGEYIVCFRDKDSKFIQNVLIKLINNKLFLMFSKILCCSFLNTCLNTSIYDMDGYIYMT